MIAPARFPRVSMAGNYAINSVSRAFFNASAAWPRTALKQREACDRSVRAADAVRDRSAQACALRLTLAFAVSRTPARGFAGIVSATSGGACGSGEAVPKGTYGNRIRNRYPVDLARFYRRFPWFPLFGHSQMRARVCTHTCAYTRGEKQGTREPLFFSVVKEKVSGSQAVPKRFPREPMLSTAAKCDILAGGYAWGSVAFSSEASISGRNRGRGGESFGVFGLGLVAIGAAGGLELEQLRNGGIPPVSSGRIGLVGRAMLEGEAQGLDAVRFSAPCILPSRSARTPRPRLARLAQVAPLCPHSPGRSPLAPCRASVAEIGSTTGSRRLRAREAIAADGRGLAGCAKVEAGLTGRGEVFRRSQARSEATGRGEGWRVRLGSASRRNGHASGEVACVN